MKRRTNKIKLTGLLLALLMLLSIGGIAASAQELSATDSSLIVAVEAFSIGNGYAAAPAQVSFAQGENGAQILDRVLKENGLSQEYSGTLTDKYYLSPSGLRIPIKFRSACSTISAIISTKAPEIRSASRITPRFPAGL